MHPFVATFYGLAALADKTPADKDVKAGWGAFWIFVGLAVAVGLLCWSLVRHLRKAKLNADSGVFGEDDEAQQPH